MYYKASLTLIDVYVLALLQVRYMQINAHNYLS